MPLLNEMKQVLTSLKCWLDSGNVGLLQEPCYIQGFQVQFFS